MNELLTLQQLLEKYPIQKKDFLSSKFQHFFWYLDLNCSLDVAWSYLSDTSNTNRLIELPEMKFWEKEGKVFGSAVVSGMRMEWEEVPWEWEYKTYLKNARIYSKGPLKYLRGLCYFENYSESHTRVYVCFSVVPTNLLSFWIAKIIFKKVEGKYKKVLIPAVNDRKHTKEILEIPNIEEPNILEKKLERHRNNLLSKDLEPLLLEKVLDYISNGNEEYLYRIRVKKLAEEWNIDYKELLSIFLYGTKEGLFTLTWDVICPHCRGVRTELNHLGEVPPAGSCEVCAIDFGTDKINSIEITFHIHPSIRAIPKRLFCSAEPAKKPHIKIQKEILNQQTIHFTTALEEGRYRVRIKGEQRYSMLDLSAISTTKELFIDTGNLALEYSASANPIIQLKGSPDKDNVFVVEEYKEDKYLLRPVDLFLFQDFRDLFSEEVVASGMNLDVGNQTILFTDIVGSTKLYSSIGDSEAFGRVKEHFEWIYDSIKKHNGALVKTIGDAAMAAFTNPFDAMNCGLEMQSKFTDGNKLGLKIRVSIHSGPCISVNLNSNIDFFGNTVNLSAKLQIMSGAGQIVFTETIYNDNSVKSLLTKRNKPIEKVDFLQKWNDQKLLVYRL